MELDTDSLMAETECVEKPPKTEKPQMGWAHTTEWGHNEWLGDMGCLYWFAPNEWVELELRRKIRVVS